METDDEVFRALADPTRRLLLDRLFERDGRTLGELTEEVPALSRFGVMKHLAVLEDAGLVVTRKQGRFKAHYLNPVPIVALGRRWVDKYRRGPSAALLDLKQIVEELDVMTDATQVYRVYINASAEEVWKAITTPQVVARFFHAGTVEGGFGVGERIRTLGPAQEKWGDNTVLESDPPKRLVHTWRSLYDPQMARESESRVTWEVEPLQGDFTRLTLTHDQLEGAPKTAVSISGWSYYLSSLKSLLENGEPLPPFPG